MYVLKIVVSMQKKMGEIVTDRLNQSFVDLMNYDFTANMEDVLDQIASGTKDWKTELNQFFKDFSKQLSKAELDELEGGMHPNSLVPTDIHCPTCSRNMAIRTASTGVFLGCTGYSLPPKERCKTTINLIPEAELLNVLDDASETKALMERKRVLNAVPQWIVILLIHIANYIFAATIRIVTGI